MVTFPVSPTIDVPIEGAALVEGDPLGAAEVARVGSEVGPAVGEKVGM